jgi:RND family efflux transporter MFP subunit
MNTKIKGLLIMSAVAAIAAGIFYKKVIEPKTVSAPTPVIIPKTDEHTVFGVGTLEAKEVVVIAPKIPAKIQAVFADEGDVVTQNQLLAACDTSELQAQSEENNASIAKSRSQLASAKAQIESLKAKKNLADATLKRYRILLKDKYIAQAQYDEVMAAAKSADAELVSASENLKLLSSDIAKSHATLKSTEAKIDDLMLKSPIDGIVLSRNAEAGSTIGAGSAVFRIANPKTLWVKIYVDERQSGLVKIGQSATVELRSLPNQPFKGEVSRIGAESDRITEERPVYIRLLEAPKSLHIGEQAEAQIFTTDKSDANP